MIYLDSAATSLMKPERVKTAVKKAMEELGSPGRGGHPPALAAAELVYTCREAAADLFEMREPENVVFTYNATHALNIAIRSLVKPGAKVLISGYEHNSVTRPLAYLGAKIIVAGEKLFDQKQALSSFAARIDEAEIVICTHVSNVFGYILPVEEIGKLCRKKHRPYIVDASQSAGIRKVSMKEIPADFICLPGHKGLLGPQGTGLLLCNAAAKPLIYGGSGSDSLTQDMPAYLPDRLEAGTQNVCGIAGLLEGLRYIRSQDLEALEEKERKLMQGLMNELAGEPIEWFYGEKEQSTVLSIRTPKIPCEALAALLGEQGICVRAGLHCAPLAHRSAGTLKTGTTRLSFSPFLSEAEVWEAANKLKQILNHR